LKAQGRLPDGWEAHTTGNHLNYTEMPTDRFESLVEAMHVELAEPTYLRSFYLSDLRRRPLYYAWELAGRLVRSPLKTGRRVVEILRGRAAQRKG
jgi:hypothetical protein